MATTTASATSMNFVGFEEAAKNSTAPILFNRIYIAPNQPITAGRQIHAKAGFLPGQQPYLKINRDVWNKSRIAQNLRLQGYRRV
jgi:hypothetical protein